MNAVSVSNAGEQEPVYKVLARQGHNVCSKELFSRRLFLFVAF